MAIHIFSLIFNVLWQAPHLFKTHLKIPLFKFYSILARETSFLSRNSTLPSLDCAALSVDASTMPWNTLKCCFWMLLSFFLMSVLCVVLIRMEAPGAEAGFDLYFLELFRINFIQWHAEWPSVEAAL